MGERETKLGGRSSPHGRRGLFGAVFVDRFRGTIVIVDVGKKR